MTGYKVYTSESNGNSNDEKISQSAQSSKFMQKLVNIVEELREDTKQHHREKMYGDEWKMVSNVLDRCFLIIFLIMDILVAIAILGKPFFGSEENYHERIV